MQSATPADFTDFREPPIWFVLGAQAHCPKLIGAGTGKNGEDNPLPGFNSSVDSQMRKRIEYQHQANQISPGHGPEVLHVQELLTLNLLFWGTGAGDDVMARRQTFVQNLCQVHQAHVGQIGHKDHCENRPRKLHRASLLKGFERAILGAIQYCTLHLKYDIYSTHCQ